MLIAYRHGYRPHPDAVSYSRSLRTRHVVVTETSGLLKAFFFARQPPVGQGLLIHEVSRSHTTTHHSR